MFIAHLPSGYLLGRWIRPIVGDGRNARGLMAAALLGSVLPDFDLGWFYTVDARQHLHHSYWTHLPIFWLVVALVGAGIVRPFDRRRLGPWLVLMAGVGLHLILDSVAGGIRWAAPWSAHEFRLVDVPARHGWWVWNFVLHPSFLLEIALLAGAVGPLRRGGSRPPDTRPHRGRTPGIAPRGSAPPAGPRGRGS